MENIGISLEPPNEQQLELGLDQQISRITQERGSFADLDETKLKEEEDKTKAELGSIKEEDNGDDDAMDVDPDADSHKEEKPNFDELRAQLVAKVGTALNETALNLDFVSLLVSASRPQAGESSISPMLKSQTPLGSLNAESVATPASTVPATSSYGWKVKAYSRSATSLSDASKRLSAEAQKEAQFWKDLLETTSNGEVVNRKLRVKYGYRDSGSTYFNKGAGSFLRDETSGHAQFKANESSALKLVRVTVFADGGSIDDQLKQDGHDGNEAAVEQQTPEPERIVGQSVLPYMDFLSDLKEPLHSVRVERNNLFEHELMYQLVQEARGDLAPHRVKLHDGGKVVCELFGGRIELDMVDDVASEDSAPKSELPLSNPAQAINYSLHLLLTQRYKAQLDRQHDIPAPLTSKHSSQPSQQLAGQGQLPGQNAGQNQGQNKSLSVKKNSPTVLQPVLAYVHHSILVARTLKLVQVMLPNSHINVESPAPASLYVEPKCLLKVDHKNTTIAFEIRSPVSNSDEPMVVVSTPTKTTDIYDLTELELWLKWVTKLDS